MSILGLVLAMVGYLFLARGARARVSDKIGVKLSVFEFSTGIVGATIALGLSLLLFGTVVIASGYHQPFARWIGGVITSLVEKKDPQVAGEFNDESMRSIEGNFGQNGLYVVQLTDAVKREKITGIYEKQRCYAELVTQICRQESQRLNCKVDSSERIIKVCRIGQDKECAGK